jgi:hypothetical protein
MVCSFFSHIGEERAGRHLDFLTLCPLSTFYTVASFFVIDYLTPEQPNGFGGDYLYCWAAAGASPSLTAFLVWLHRWFRARSQEQP